jgi:hypothetical protein
MHMNKTATFLATCAAAALLAGCASSGQNPISAPNVANLNSNVLQMNVGTANIYGLTTGINVAVTYRQPSGALNPGASATLVNTPTLTLPHAIAGAAGAADKFNATILTGPAAAEIGTTSMTATPQTPNAANVTTFGTDGGAFGLGLEPFNYGSVSGIPDNVTPYAVPLYDALAGGAGGDPNQFIPGGGPPAFSTAGNTAAVLGGFDGVSEGLDVFEVAPATGTYSLSVAIPANTGTVTQSATATMSSTAPLGAFTQPVPTLVGTTGGATLPVVLPAGVTEAYIQVVDFGPTAQVGTPAGQATSCVGATAGNPVYYTIEIKASGTATLPAGSLCTVAQNTTATTNAQGAATASDGDAFTVQAVGFDYGAYEASYPSSLGVTSPSLTGAGASHQADVTISTQGVYNQPAAGGIVPGALPASVRRIGASSARR